MIHTILVPTDFSEGADTALQRAEDLAKSTHAELVLVHVQEDFPLLAPDVFGYVPPTLAAEMRAALAKQLEDKVLSTREHGVPARGVLVMGAPHLEIANAAKHEKADMIVMGTTGRRGFAHLMLGSVAERVARTTKTPVLVVPSHGPT
jgi:nucleotide-binding universal stress UspA family protein